jgi:hypothetical protein
MPNAAATVTDVPGSGSDSDIEATARRCRKLVNQRALMAAGVAMVPQINAAFGLTPEQIERLAPDRRVVVYKAISAGGGLLVGKLITQELALKVLKVVGVRLTAQQAAKYVPLAGQAVSAALTFTALRYVCHQHIRQCMAVSRALQLPAPGTASRSA